MIETGTCFCYNCGNLFRDAYYKTGTQPVGAKLFHSKTRLGKDDWEIQPYRADGGQIKFTDAPQLLRVNGGTDGVPNSIYARYENGGEHELVRCCPMCQKVDTKLPVDSGRYPTFVIAVVGGRTVGKSTWLKAISNSKNLEAVNRISKYPYKLDFLRKHSTFGEEAATNRGSAGETNYLRILNGKGEIVASVILLDAAGELYETIGETGNPLRKFLLGNGEYKGVDGVIYMESALAQSCEIRTKSDLENAKAAFQVYSEMEKEGVLQGKPTAFVCTHADRMLEVKHRVPKLTDLSGEEEVALYTEATFRSNTSYEPRELLLRLAQEDMIARELNSDVLKTTERKRRGFMIQSCVNKQLEGGGTYNDMSKNFNVMDPLLWILNALRIFPIEQE